MNKIEQHSDDWILEGDIIPKNPNANIKNLKWFETDSRENFLKNKPKGWSEDSVDYSFNSDGYRSVEFVRRPQKNSGDFSVASFGCSATFGVGVPVEQTWPELFKGKMEQQLQKPVINYNFGLGGGSMDLVSRLLYHSLPFLKPNLVLVLMPSMYRRELYDDYGYARRVTPSDKSYQKYYEDIVNEHEARNNFLKNVAFIKTLLDLHNTNHVFGFWGGDDRAPLRSDPHVIRTRWRWPENGRKARDCMHAGVKSYDTLSNLFIDHYNEMY